MHRVITAMTLMNIVTILHRLSQILHQRSVLLENLLVVLSSFIISTHRVTSSADWLLRLNGFSTCCSACRVKGHRR